MAVYFNIEVYYLFEMGLSKAERKRYWHEIMSKPSTFLEEIALSNKREEETRRKKNAQREAAIVQREAKKAKKREANRKRKEEKRNKLKFQKEESEGDSNSSPSGKSLDSTTNTCDSSRSSSLTPSSSSGSSCDGWTNSSSCSDDSSKTYTYDCHSNSDVFEETSVVYNYKDINSLNAVIGNKMKVLGDVTNNISHVGDNKSTHFSIGKENNGKGETKITYLRKNYT